MTARKIWREEAALLCGINAGSVENYCWRLGAPRQVQCFWLWFLAREQKKAQHRKTARDKIRENNRMRYHNNANYRSRLKQRERERLLTPHGRAVRRRIHAAYKLRHRDDPQYRVKRAMSARLHKAMARIGRPKSSQTMKYLGCSEEFLKTWLKAQFKFGMTWENYGTYWHIDHVIPCARFDLTDSRQQAAAFHYTNLQPLEAVKNASKGCRVRLEDFKIYEERARQITTV